MKKRLLILWLPVFFSLAAICQDKTAVDSLLQQLELAEADTSKVNIYLKLWDEFDRSDPAKAIEYAGKAKQLAEKIGYARGIARASYRLGNLYTDQGDLEHAKAALQESLTLSKQLNDSNFIASALSGLATVYRRLTATDSATAFYLQALAIFERLEKPNDVARIHNALGNLYNAQHQQNKALTHYEKALEMVRELDFLPGISACLGNIGAVYLELEKPAAARPYLEEALEIKIRTNDKIGEARTLHNLGNVHRSLENHDDAHNYYLQALELAEEMSQTRLIAMSQYSLGFNEFERGNYREAIRYGEMSAQHNLESNDLRTMVVNQELLAGAYAAINDFEKAFEHSMLAKEFSDSLYNEQRLKLSSELEAKYQNEKNQKEIAELNAAREINTLKLQQRRNERNYLIGVALLVLLLGVVIWSRYRIKARTNRKLMELDQIKSRFFANISHEFRTPLTLILGPLRQLQREDFDGDKQALYQVMQRNSQGLLHMVDQLLDLSKIESDKMDLHAVETGLFSFIKPIAAAYESLATSKGIHFKVSVEKEIRVYADHEKLEKILHNLLSNAFKFTGKGGEITLVADRFSSRGKSHARISIKDTGTGIAAPELARIFDRFYQAGSAYTGGHQGTGIGLALTRELVALHRGEIKVSSTPGEGTCFTILLPLGRAHLSSAETAAPPVVASGTVTPAETATAGKTATPAETATPTVFSEPEDQHPHLLIVEDNLDMQAFLVHILEPHYRVTTTSNGREGLEKARELQPDLVLSDVMMPEMDGIELCRRLKLDENISHIPVILLTAKSGKEPRIEGLETGADDYLTKPFDADELLALLKNRICQRALLRERFSREITLQPKDIAITSADERFLRKAMEIVEDNMADFEFNVKAFIKQMALGRSQVEAKLKALTGQTPVEFIRILRLKRAAQKIAGKEDTISQIAYSVGFNNLSYFAKCFKEQFGESPSTWTGQPVNSN